MKLHRQYVNFLHLIVTSQLSNEVSCDEHCTLEKCGVLFDIISNALCDELIMNLV